MTVGNIAVFRIRYVDPLPRCILAPGTLSGALRGTTGAFTTIVTVHVAETNNNHTGEVCQHAEPRHKHLAFD